MSASETNVCVARTDLSQTSNSTPRSPKAARQSQRSLSGALNPVPYQSSSAPLHRPLTATDAKRPRKYRQSDFARCEVIYPHQSRNTPRRRRVRAGRRGSTAGRPTLERCHRTSCSSSVSVETTCRAGKPRLLPALPGFAESTICTNSRGACAATYDPEETNPDLGQDDVFQRLGGPIGTRAGLA